MRIVNYQTKKSFGVRLEARLKNSALVEAREKLGLNIKEASERIGISYHSYTNSESMKSFPSQELQVKICDFYRKKGIFLLEEDVFPEELRNVKIKGKYIADREVPVENLVSLSTINERYLPYGKNIEETYYKEHIKEMIHHFLSFLKPRDQEIINLLFGLHGGEPKTLEETGKAISISHERVRQIEERVLYSLRKTCQKYGLSD